MPWPSDQDYNEAVQNPTNAFSDQELKTGRIELNAMGLPKARSGNFATVYKVETAGGAQAVRCFRYDNPEHCIRYPAVASYLSQNALPYMVSFRFMSEGIRAGSKWYPTVKMKWVDGDSLVSYIEKNLSSQTALKNLAAGWAKMLTDLQRVKIAHGDLQHGNVLVVGGKLRLVDYDGMYVPALEGSRGLELGHRNYQHPQRTELDFGPHLDNFSAWLIYVSIVALATQPNLWGQLKAGDECLLFRREDLDAPDKSAAFRLLRALPDHRVRNLADQLEHFLWLPPDKVPLISDSAIDAEIPGRAPGSFAPGTSWISDYTQPSVARPTADDFPVVEVGDQTWIQDHVSQEFDLGSFVNRANVDRLIAIPVFLAALTLSAWLSVGRTPVVEIALWIAGTGAASGVTLACWRIRYRGEPVSGTIRAVKSDLRRVSQEDEGARQGLAELKAKRLRRWESYSADCLLVQKRKSVLQSDEVNRLSDIDGVLRAALQQINNRQRSTTAEEGAEKRKLLETIGGEISRLSHALSSLPVQERQEITRVDSDLGAKVNGLTAQLRQSIFRRDTDLRVALREYQDQIVNGHLHKIPLSGATIPGVGPQLKRRLAIAGIVSAGDIGTRHATVPGIGTKKWADLHVWRSQLEGPIRRREAPSALPLHKRASIEQRYDTQISQFQRSLAQEQTRLMVSKQEITTRFLNQKQLLEAQKMAAESNLREQTLAIEKKYDESRRLIANDEQTARLHFQQSTDTCLKQVRSAAALLADESEQLRKEYSANLDALNRDIEAAAMRVREASWRREQATRKYSAYTSLDFRHYAIRALRKW